ncbi:small kinetochore-associated protein [Syngnathus scovelli]|uniref:small kinetochore-associated protein n=1 Tax=Syngnathus scovelli TaxID=161590 RepID=UPI00210F96AA|nr:small kinetochore-associated protein [Syngnathus scovelli]XP_049613978.1 small kinetochore-associated protein [Syngnathus scovelli]
MSKIPKGQLHTESKKSAHKNETATSAKSHQKDGVLRQKEHISRENVAPKVYKAISSRYELQAELKEQNQRLVAAKEELQKNLTETQQRVNHLEQQYSELENENSKVQKNLKDCQTILVSAKIDPISGEVIGETARQNEEQRKEVMSVSTDLLKELKDFGDIATQQRSQLQELQKTMLDLTEAREQMMQERQAFALEVAELEKALTEAEALLL